MGVGWGGLDRCLSMLIHHLTWGGVDRCLNRLISHPKGGGRSPRGMSRCPTMLVNHPPGWGDLRIEMQSEGCLVNLVFKTKQNYKLFRTIQSLATKGITFTRLNTKPCMLKITHDSSLCLKVIPDMHAVHACILY